MLASVVFVVILVIGGDSKICFNRMILSSMAYFPRNYAATLAPVVILQHSFLREGLTVHAGMTRSTSPTLQTIATHKTQSSRRNELLYRSASLESFDSEELLESTKSFPVSSKSTRSLIGTDASLSSSMPGLSS